MEPLKNHVCPHHPPDETGDPLSDIKADPDEIGELRRLHAAAHILRALARRLCMRVGDVFRDADVVRIDELRAAREAADHRGDADKEGEATSQ